MEVSETGSEHESRRAAGAVDVILRDGSTLRLVQPTASDTDAILAFLGGLSERSLYQRFHGFPAIGPRLIEPLLEPDWSERGAYIAWLSDGGNERIVAAGNDVRLHAMNRLWAVPHRSRPSFLLARFRSLVLLIVLGGSALASTVLSVLASFRSTYPDVSKGLFVLAGHRRRRSHPHGAREDRGARQDGTVRIDFDGRHEG